MEAAARIERIRKMLGPMVEQGIITPEQEAECEQGIMNLVESFTKERRPGAMEHHHHFTHDVLVQAIFNPCGQAAVQYAMSLNIESVTE